MPADPSNNLLVRLWDNFAAPHFLPVGHAGLITTRDYCKNAKSFGLAKHLLLLSLIGYNT